MTDDFETRFAPNISATVKTNLLISLLLQHVRLKVYHVYYIHRSNYDCRLMYLL